MDQNLEAQNPPLNRGVYSPVSANNKPKDGHTSLDTDSYKECFEMLKKFVENYENYTADNFLVSFRSNYPTLKLFLLKNLNDPASVALKTRCLEALDAYIKTEQLEIPIRREFVSICLNTFLMSSTWDDICHKILRHFLLEPKHFVNLVQVEQFFELFIRLLNSYPDLQEKDIKKLLICLNVIDMLFVSPLFMKNMVQILPGFTRVINIKSKDHMNDCFYELVKLSCTSLHMFNQIVAHGSNYPYYVNEVFTHLSYLVKNTNPSNGELLTNILTSFLVFFNSGVNKALCLSTFEPSLYNKLYDLSRNEYGLTCNVLFFFNEVLRKLDVDQFSKVVFDKCSSLVSQHWFSSNYKTREACFNIIYSLLCHMSKASSNMDSEFLTTMYKFSVITFFQSVNYIKDMYYTINIKNNGFSLYVKNTLNLYFEVIVLNYKLLIQLNNIKRLLFVYVLQTFVYILKLVALMYPSLRVNKECKMEQYDDDKNYLLVVLDNNIKMLCRTLESPYVENGIRLVLPILLYYYLNPSKQLFVNEDLLTNDQDMKVDDENYGSQGVEGFKSDNKKVFEKLMLYVLYSFSRNFPDLFMQQYMSLLVQLLNNEYLEDLFKYSYNVVFQRNPKTFGSNAFKELSRSEMLTKLLDDNIFVGLKYNLDSIKYIYPDLNHIVGELYRYYPEPEEKSTWLNKEVKDNMVEYLRVLTVVFGKINYNMNYSYIYEKIGSLHKLVYRLLFYQQMSDYKHVDLVSNYVTQGYGDVDSSEDMYAFLIVVSMNNTQPEYVKTMLKVANYIFNFSKSKKLLKYSLLLLESYSESPNIGDLYYLLAKYIRPLKRETYKEIDDGNEDEEVEPYFIKLLFNYLINDNSSDISRLVLNILGKLGSLSQKFKLTNKLESTQEFSLAFACATQKDATVVSVPVEKGIDSMVDRLANSLYNGGEPLSLEEYDNYCGYLLVVMSPVLKYDTSFTQLYVDCTKKLENESNGSTKYSNDDFEDEFNFNKTQFKEKLDNRQMEYLGKLFRCLCMLLDYSQYVDRIDSSEYENLLLFRNTLLEYSFLSGPNTGNKRDNVVMMVSLLLSNLKVRYSEIDENSTNASLEDNKEMSEQYEDSSLNMLLEIFDRSVREDLEEVVEYFVSTLILKLNEKSVYRRLNYFYLLLRLFENEHNDLFKHHYGYLYNVLLCTLVDFNSMNNELLVDRRSNMKEEELLLTLMKLLVKYDNENMFNNLTYLLNNSNIKLRLLALQILNEYKQQKLVQYFNNHFKNLEYLEVYLLSTQYTQNQHSFNNGFKKLSSFLNNYKEDSVEIVVYLAVLELVMFDSKFEKMFNQLSHDVVDYAVTSLINVLMMSNGLVFNMSLNLFKKVHESSPVNQHVLMTLQPYVIQLQTVFNYCTVERLMLFHEICGDELKCIKEPLYNASVILGESRINVSELQTVKHMEFSRFLDNLGYSNKMLVNNCFDSNSVTSPIMIMQLYNNYVFDDGNFGDKDNKTVERDKSEKEGRIVDEMKLYDVLYLIDDNVVKNNFNRLNNELNNNNNLNVIFEILCFLEFLSNIKSLLVSTKEFKNVVRTVVTLSNPDIFGGHYLHHEVRLQPVKKGEDEKDLDEIIYTLISNKCYELLQLHYPSTEDILNQYNYTPYSYLNNSELPLNVFNRFIFDNLELFNNLYLSKSTSHYLYNTKLMVLLRVVYFVNNNEDLLKGNLLIELMNYIYYMVLEKEYVLTFGGLDQTKGQSELEFELDTVLYKWMGYYVLSKICHLCNINYMVVATFFKHYIEFIKSNEFMYFSNKLHNVPIEFLLVLNNRYPLSGDETNDIENPSLDFDEFNNYHQIIKKISFNFFNCLCNLTIYTTVNGSKKYQPIMLHLFNLSNTALAYNTSFSPSASPTNLALLKMAKDDMNVLIILLTSFMSYLNNYRKLMNEHFQRFVEYAFNNNNQGYYYNRCVFEIVVGIILIYESNQYMYNKYKLLMVYFRSVNNLKIHLNKHSFFKDRKSFDKLLYKYNGILCKLCGYKLLDYVNHDTNKFMYHNILLKLLYIDYPQLFHIIKRVVKTTFFMSQPNLNSLVDFLKNNNNERSEEKGDDNNNKFLEFLLSLISSYLHSNNTNGVSSTNTKGQAQTNNSSTNSGTTTTTSQPQTTGQPNLTSFKERPNEDTDYLKVKDFVDMLNLFMDVIMVINVKNVLAYLNQYLQLFVSKLFFLLKYKVDFCSDKDTGFVTFLELCLLLLYRFDPVVQNQFLVVVELVSMSQKSLMANLLFNLYYIQPYLGSGKKDTSKYKLSRQDSQSSDVKRTEYDPDVDSDYNFFDYNGSYLELSEDSIDRFELSDLTLTNKKIYKITFNQLQFSYTSTPITPLGTKDLFKYIKSNLDHFKLDLICNLLYHVRHLSYPPQKVFVKPVVGSGSGSFNKENNPEEDEKHSFSNEFNTLFLNVLKHEGFKNLKMEVKMNYLTHCLHISDTSEFDFSQFYGLQENTYHTLEFMFKYNQNSRTLMNVFFMLFDQDIELAISSNYPRLHSLSSEILGNEELQENGKQNNVDSQINFICNNKSAIVKPILNILKDFRKLSLSNDQEQNGSLEDNEEMNEQYEGSSSKRGNELELTMDTKLYDELNNINQYAKVYLTKYVNMKVAIKYIRKVCELHREYSDLFFVKVFQQLYINLSESYRSHMVKLIVEFMTNKIKSLSYTNELYDSPRQYYCDHLNLGHDTPVGDVSFNDLNSESCYRLFVDEDSVNQKHVLKLVYSTVINTYPMIVLPVELIKYLSYYLEGNYFNSCFYLEKLILTQPLDITKIASILSDVYMKLDLVDMSIGSNRCWVITNETRLALANLQHSKWKQAQREFNQIMEYLSSSGQSSETVAWFDESKLWFNHWLYCTKQLNEWDIIRDISYISNNKFLFKQSNVYLNSYPHLMVVNNANKDNHLLVSQDLNNDNESMELENTLEMNMYNVSQRLFRIYYNNTNNIGSLYKQYNKEYYKLRGITQNCAWWLLSYYKNIGNTLNHGHVNCMRMNQRVVELNEGLAYLKRVTDNLYKSENINEFKLVNKWRVRLPNKSDQPSNWNNLFSFRTFIYSTVKNLMNLTNNNVTQNDSLSINQDYIWTLVKYSCVTRKSHQLPLMASVLLNKAQKYLVSSVNKSSYIGEDYYLLINERLKQYLSFSINVPDALKTVISLDFDKLPNRGFETLKAHVTRLKAEAVNRNYIYDIHQNQNNPNKRQMGNPLGDIDLACKYMLEALKLQPLLSKNWISWAKFNDNKIDHSLISVWSKNEQMFPLDLYETSIMGYLTAISINPNCHWLLIKRIFTLLNEIHKSINNTSESFKKYSEYVHHCVWLTWLPQLVWFLYSKNNIEMFHLLKLLVNKVPQQVYYTVRTEYLSLLHGSSGGSSGFNSKEGESVEETNRQSLGDTKNILQILINNNASLNHHLENFCNVLTNMGRPDPLDEVLCAYETIFEECLDLPFHEPIPKPMLYCITHKILSKLSTNQEQNGALEDDEDDNKELFNKINSFTQDFMKPAQTTTTPSNSPTRTETGEKNITCGYTMNKLLDIINTLVNYSSSKNNKLRKRSLNYLLNYNICNVSNKVTSETNMVIQLPHMMMNNLDEILKNKNVLGEVYDVLYVDPNVFKMRRRNQMVKCLKIVTTDGQNHYYTLYPLVRARQKSEEYLYQMSQLLNFYFKKYNETRRRNLWIPSSILVPLDPYISLVQDSPNNITLLNLYNNTISLKTLLLNSLPVNKTTTSGSASSYSGTNTVASRTPAFPKGNKTTMSSKNGYETCLLLLVLHKILLEKNITNKLYECYNKYNPTHPQFNPSTKSEDDNETNVGFNYIYKLFKDKQYPWFITWYRKIHQDVLQDAYNKLCNLVPDNVLLSYVLKVSTDYQEFINFRMSFTSSYATQAVLSLILATPYATPSRLLLNLSNGSMRQLDYKLFNRDMEPNKLRVFRLTRNMTNLMGSTCRLGLLPAVMFSIASSVHHFKIDIHAALSAILSATNFPNKESSSSVKDSPNFNKENNKETPVLKETKSPKLDKLDDIDEYLSKILNYCSYLRSPADQEHSNVPINNVITCIIDASTDSSMLGKLKTSYQPWF